MKYHLLLCLGIISFAQANTPVQDPFPHHPPNKETDGSWEPFSEAKPSETNHKKGHTSSGIVKDEILTPERKKLDPELADLVINMSSEEAQQLALIIQECAKDPSEKCPPRVLLIGAPGIGKTTFIQAVAEKADIPLKIIDSPFVLDKYKDSGPVNLQLIFDSFLHTKTKIIVAFDELHCLTDGHKNSNDPNPNTAAALWKLLDQCRENPNIIFVGIMNDASNMPKQLKSRFEKCIYRMKSTDEIAQIQKILHHYLKKYKHDCDEKCQLFIARLLKTGEARSIEGTVERAYWDSYTQEGRKITQKKLETTIKEGNENKKELNKNEPDQATKTLIAQEREANSGTIRNYATVGAIGGTGVAYIVDKNGGWAKVWEVTKGACIQLGKVALVITKHTLKAGAEYCVEGKIPNPKKVIQDMVKDEIFVEVKVPNDKEQK